MPRIAYLGTGRIGTGMIEAALERAEDVVVWNRTLDRALPLGQKGAAVAASPTEAAVGAERIHLALHDDDAVDEVLAQLVPEPDAVIVDHTTTSAARTAARAARLDAQGLSYLHAPVFMSPMAARSCQGLMIVAGPHGRFHRVAGALRKMTGELWWVGERSDLAAAYKLFGNAMLMAMIGGLADVLQIARNLDIDPVEAHALFTKWSPAPVLQYRGANMAKGDFAPMFALDTARKDVALMLEAGGDGPMALLPALMQRMDALIAAGHAGEDVGVLAIDALRRG